MKLLTYRDKNNFSHVGELVEDRVYRCIWDDTMTRIIQRGATPRRTNEYDLLEEVRLQAPLRPGKIIAIGKNYADHAAETGSEVPSAPLIFAKFSSGIIPTGAVITWDAAVTQQVDWEGELAVIIGKQAHHVAEEDAYDYVFGYTIANDVSARDIQSSESQWIRAKNLHTFCPLGPGIVTHKTIGDPQKLSIQTKVNGDVMQDGNTSQMVFTIPFLVAYLSKMFVLESGDMILTGTPAGVGKGMKPPRFLTDGDEVSITIEEIGTLTNTCKVRVVETATD